jgi:hypothetical protein
MPTHLVYIASAIAGVPSGMLAATLVNMENVVLACISRWRETDFDISSDKIISASFRVIAQFNFHQ